MEKRVENGAQNRKPAVPDQVLLMRLMLVNYLPISNQPHGKSAMVQQPLPMLVSDPAGSAAFFTSFC